MLVPDEEYSEAGRGVYPDGLFNVLMMFHQRYLKTQPNLRYIVTENGFADAEDLLRRPYLLEHLLAVNAARKEVGKSVSSLPLVELSARLSPHRRLCGGP